MTKRMKADFSVCTLSFLFYSSRKGGSDSKESTPNVGDLGSIPGWGRSPGGGHGYPLQCSCQENPTDRGAWRATVHGVAKSQTRLSNEAHCCADNRVSSPGSPASGETVLRASLSRGEHRHTHVGGGRTNGGRAGTAAAGFTYKGALKFSGWKARTFPFPER